MKNHSDEYYEEQVARLLEIAKRFVWHCEHHPNQVIISSEASSLVYAVIGLTDKGFFDFIAPVLLRQIRDGQIDRAGRCLSCLKKNERRKDGLCLSCRRLPIHKRYAVRRDFFKR